MKKKSGTVTIPAWKFEHLVRDSETLSNVRTLVETDAYMNATLDVLLGIEREAGGSEEN